MQSIKKIRPAQPRVSVIVPAKNEAANLREILPLFPAFHEVILVDGNSVDGTVEAAREVMPSIRVVRQTRKGKGNAMICGMEAATGDILVMFDADGSADPGEIQRFVDALVDGADFAKGSRYCKGGGSEDLTLLRSAGNLGLNTVMNVMYLTKYTDLCYGYNAFWADMVPSLRLPSAAGIGAQWGDGFEIEALIACRMASVKAKTAEVPSVELERIHGESNLRTWADGWRVLKTLVRERSRNHSRVRALAHAAEQPA